MLTSDVQFYKYLICNNLIPSVTLVDGLIFVNQKKRKKYSKLNENEISILRGLSERVSYYTSIIKSPENVKVKYFEDKIIDRIIERANQIEDIIYDKYIELCNKVIWTNYLAHELIEYAEDVCKIMESIKTWENEGKEVHILMNNGKTYFGNYIGRRQFMTVGGNIVNL